MDQPLIRTFSYHYRQKYGHTVGKIPVDLGQPCPNRANGGCIFCQPASFTPSYLRQDDTLANQVAKGRKQLFKAGYRKYFAYFQQETCTSLPTGDLLPAWAELLVDDDCVGLILSTRPDYVSDDLINALTGLIGKTGKECLFELGIQTAHDRSLKLLNRNHNFSDCADAVRRIKEPGCFEVGAHLIFGVPGESEENMLSSIRRVSDLGVNALKLHHMQVIRGTQLHAIFQQGKVVLFSLEEYLLFLLRALPIIPAEVVLHRLWATAHPHLLVGPKWNILAAKLSIMLREKMLEQGIRQGQGSVK